MPKDWGEGYYTDLEYTSGYYHEMGPAHLKFTCLAAGIHHQVSAAPACLELGFGQGISVNIHGAAGEGVWWGTDFNPAHVVHARSLAAESGGDLHLYDDAFAVFAARDDLPEFDIITLHGVWSWVSDANRAAIIDLIRRRLRPGGLVYVSYNCQPGWAARSPVRHLLNLGRGQAEEGPAGAAAGGDVERALAFVEDVAAVGGKFFADVPPALRHARSLSRQSRRYLAHEYLNAAWHVPHFSETAAELGEAKLTFVASARHLDRVQEIHLAPEGVALIDRMKDPVLRESVRDYLVNQRFRPDVFIKGAVLMSAAEQEQAWDAQGFVLVSLLDEIDFRITGALGEAVLPEATYRPLVEGLAAGGYRAKSLAELRRQSAIAGLRRSDLVSALTILVGMGHLRPSTETSEAVIARCQAYNRHVLVRAMSGRQLKHMASPVTGGGVMTSRSTQLFLIAWLDGVRAPADLAARIWSVFEKTHERAVKDGNDVVTREDNLVVLEGMASRFVDQIVPLYTSLGILPVRGPEVRSVVASGRTKSSAGTPRSR